MRHGIPPSESDCHLPSNAAMPLDSSIDAAISTYVCTSRSSWLDIQSIGKKNLTKAFWFLVLTLRPDSDQTIDCAPLYICIAKRLSMGHHHVAIIMWLTESISSLPAVLSALRWSA